MSNKIHTKNKEYYTYFISNKIKEEIDKYEDDEKKEKILENIPEDIIEQKTYKMNNNYITKNFRNCKLHFTKNNNIVNLTYNGLVNNFSLDDINNIDNTSYIKKSISFNINDIIGLENKDEEYNILQNINNDAENNILSNNIIMYGKKNDNYEYIYDYIYDDYYIYRNINIKLTYEENNKINLISDLLMETIINDEYYIIYNINGEKYYIDNNILKNINGGEDIEISIINLNNEENNFIGEINFDNIKDYVLLMFSYSIGSGGMLFYSLYNVDKINKKLTRINNEEVKLCIKDTEEKLYLIYSYNYNNKTLNTLTSFNFINKDINDLNIWLSYYIIHKNNIIINNNYNIINDNYDDKLYSKKIYPPTGSNNYINNENNIIYNTIFPSIFNQLYYGRYIKQFSAIDPEDNSIIITYNGISSINIIENNEENNDEEKNNDEENNEEENIENGIDNNIKNYYEEEKIEDIKPNINDITENNYYELITDIYKPKTIQKLLIPIQCLYSLTTIKETFNNQNNQLNQNITNLEFLKDINNSNIIINIFLNNITNININSTDLKINYSYIPLLILPTGELILKFDEMNINIKEYLDYGKSLNEDTNLTFEYPYIWMLRKINIPSFSLTYNLNLENLILKQTDIINKIDYNAEHYKNINNINISFFSKSLN